MWFQNPKYLAWSRQQFLSQENIEKIIDTLNINSDTCVIDIGCGSGELTRRINNATSCHCIGIDLDYGLIKYAKQFENDTLLFVQGNAVNLPLTDSSADVIISHTFFTNIFDAETALLEMRRVCKETGTIVAINAETFEYVPNYNDGLSSFPWFGEYYKYKLQVTKRFLDSSRNFVNGIIPEAIPQFFIDNNLIVRDVLQLGRLYSISKIEHSDKRHEFIEFEYETDCSLAELLEDDECERYLTLLDKKRQALLSGFECFDWTGGTNMMVVAKNNKDLISANVYQAKYALVEQLQDKIKTHCANLSISYSRSGVSSISSVRIANAQGEYAIGTAAQPIDALLEAHKLFLSHMLFKHSPYNSDENYGVDKVTAKILTVLYGDAGGALISEFKDTEAIYSVLGQNQQISISTELYKWCFPKVSAFVAETIEDAMVEALYDALATYAFKQLLEENKSPTIIEMNSIDDITINKTLNMLVRSGYCVNILDISCDSNIPAIAICVFNHSISITKYASDYDINKAVSKCLLKVLQEKKIFSPLSAKRYTVCRKMNDVAIFNLLNTGEGILSDALVAPTKTSNLTVFSMPSNPYEALQALAHCHGLSLCYRYKKEAGFYFVEMIAPNLKTMWSFGRKRISEYLLHNRLKQVVATIKDSSLEDIKVLAQYMESKIAWDNENIIGFLTPCLLEIPVLHTELDFNLLMVSCCIATNQKEKAINYLNSNNPQLKCLKLLLSGASERILERLFSKEQVNNAKLYLNDPIGNIEAKDQTNEQKG